MNDDPALNENLNKVCTADYSESTKRQMALLSEKEISFELIESLLKYIKSKFLFCHVLGCRLAYMILESTDDDDYDNDLIEGYVVWRLAVFVFVLL